VVKSCGRAVGSNVTQHDNSIFIIIVNLFLL
jgi:hypothetical protein